MKVFVADLWFDHY